MTQPGVVHSVAMESGGIEELSLAQRLPGYLKSFGLGLAISAGLGAVIGVLSSARLFAAVGYTILFYGIVLLMAGGTAGGGYRNLTLGSVEALFGARSSVDDDLEAPDPDDAGNEKPRDPLARLRAGLRPEANPRAFWQVVGGFGYLAIGLGIVIAIG